MGAREVGKKVIYKSFVLRYKIRVAGYLNPGKKEPRSHFLCPNVVINLSLFLLEFVDVSKELFSTSAHGII